MNKSIVTFTRGTLAQATPLWQYDYGQVLEINGLELPTTYQVHFCNCSDTQTITVLGNADGVLIPDNLLQTGKTVIAYIYLHTGADDGETEYKITIPVRPRPAPSDIPPTPEQQSALDEAIAALNSAVEDVQDIADGIPGQINAALEEAKESGEFDGEDGYSPTVTVTEIEGGHQVTITDEDGDHVFDVMDGDGGVEIDPTLSIPGDAADAAATGAVKANADFMLPIVQDRNFPDALQLPLSVAHRGLATNSSSIIENTMPAFEDAVSKGWRYLETDIRFTSDNVCVLLHNSYIQNSPKVYIADITYAQALEYDLGNGAHIATLEELLQLCRKSHTYPVIEIKDSGISQTQVDIVWALIQKYEMEHEVFFLAASSAGIVKFLQKDPYIPTVMTGSSAWEVKDPAHFEDYPLGSTTRKYLSGKNRLFWEKEGGAFADLAAQENFIDYCHYWGIYAGVYCPTTQAQLDAKSKRFDMVTSQYYRYEIERSYGSGGGGGGTSDYADLTNKPQVNGVTLSGNKTAADLGLAPAGAYVKPSTGIPASDLASAVQTSLGKADTALQSYTETDPTVPSWAKQSSKPSYTAAEIGAIAAPASPATGAFLVWDGSAWVAQTLATWQGGAY